MSRKVKLYIANFVISAVVLWFVPTIAHLRLNFNPASAFNAYYITFVLVGFLIVGAFFFTFNKIINAIDNEK